MNKKNTIYLMFGLTAFSNILSGCIPAAIGGVGATAGAFVSEKGLSGTVADARLVRTIREKYEENSTKLYEMIVVTAYQGEIMLIGTVPEQSFKTKAVELTWQVEGVQKVIDEIQITDKEAYKNEAKDRWIVAAIKSKMMISSDIHSLNFEIYSINDIVYLSGVAYDNKEAQRVMDIAAQTSGVKKVKSYIRTKNSKRNPNQGSYPMAVQKPSVTAEPAYQNANTGSQVNSDMPKPANVIHGS